MSTMQGLGYLSLMRLGLVDAHLCRDQAYEPLKYNIWHAPYRNSLLHPVYPQMLPHETRSDRMCRALNTILAYQNRRAGRADAAVILAQGLLIDFRPRPDDGSSWPAAYQGMRIRYAEGSI